MGLFTTISSRLNAQKISNNMDYWFKKASWYVLDSNSITFYYGSRGVCKRYSLQSIKFMRPGSGAFIKETSPVSTLPEKVPFLQLHGNIAYTFDYRSQLDTPLVTKNLQQHNEQTYADATLKGRYPFRVIINSRQSNSPFFRNYTDVNIEFNHQAYQQIVRQEMIAEMSKKMGLLDSAARYERLLNGQRTAYAELKNWVESPARAQEIVQEKEASYSKYQQLANIPSAQNSLPLLKNKLKNWSATDSTLTQTDSSQANPISKDSLAAWMQQPTATEKKIQAEQKILDSLFKKISATQHYADSLKTDLGTNIAGLTDKLRNAKSVQELEDIGKKAGAGTLSKSDKHLLSVTQFGIGRSSLHYSDLTVSNVSVTGVNIEYNPSYYVAFAAGTVDYLFRDFVLNPGNMPKQNLVLGRFGWGDKERRAFIFTAYNGTKNSFGGGITDTVSLTPRINTTHILGYSLEGKYRIDQNTDASVEVAKSSSPYSIATDRGRSIGHAFTFSDRNNEAWSAKLDYAIPSTQSSFNLFYKKVGASFQSYSIYNTGNRQEAWGIKWRQYFFKNKLSLTAQVKKSSFDDPLIPNNYNSAIIFKSIQAVYRKRKWPVISTGFMPSTQLIKNSAGYLSQSVYYALTASLFYNYAFLKLPMNSSLVYSRFYNKGTDSGFILYNAKNVLYSHNMDLGKWHSQSDVQYTQQPGFAYWTFQQRMDVQIGKYLTVGAGLKNNVIPAESMVYWGGTAQMDLKFKQLGGLRMQYDKGYLPNGLNGLMPNDWGRLMWYKVF